MRNVNEEKKERKREKEEGRNRKVPMVGVGIERMTSSFIVADAVGR